MASILKSTAQPIPEPAGGEQQNPDPSVDAATASDATALSSLGHSAQAGVSARISGATIGHAKGIAGLAEFNLADIAEQGRVQIEQCRREAEAMLRQAETEAAKIRDDAKKTGHAEGTKQASVEIQKKINQAAEIKSKQQLASLHATVEGMKQQYQDWMQEYADVLTQTAISAAEQLTRSRLVAPTSEKAETTEPEASEPLLVRWAREALHSTRSAGRLTVVVHPDTLAEIGGHLDELLSDPNLPESSSVTADESLDVHDVIVRQDGGQIAAGLNAQLERLREELS